MSLATPAATHPVLIYPVTSPHEGRELARRLDPILQRLTSPDGQLAALVTAQAVTVTLTLGQLAHGDPTLDPSAQLIPTLALLISGIMVNDLTCRHLDAAPKKRWRWLR